MVRRLREFMDAAVAGRSMFTRPGLLGALAVVLLAYFAYAPLLDGGMILTGDILQVFRVFELGRCLDDGQLPCRWVPDMGNGYGFPLFNYYPPLPYYVGDLLHRIGFSYLRAVDALFVIGLVGAGLSMYALARRLWGELGGMVSAVAYVYSPYLALDVYMRGALGELWGLAIAPALLWAVYELVRSGKARYVPAVALFASLLLLSHNLLAMIMAPAVAFWAAALLATQGRRSWRPALLGIVGAIWGLGLAAFFTLPVLAEGLHVQLDSLLRWPFEYSDHFADVSGLFFTRSADYSYLVGAGNETPLQIGWFHWALAGSSLPAGLLLLRAGRRSAALAVLVFAVLFAIGVFMAVSASEAVWDAFDSLHYIQFPWRYLGLVSLASAALSGAWLAVLRDRILWQRLLLASLLIGLLVGSGRTFFEPVWRFDVSDADVFSREFFLELYREGSIGDYLPAAVDEIPEPSARPAQVVAGPAYVSAVSSGSDWMTMRVDADAPARVQAALFDFPTWRVEVNGQVVPHEASKPNGLVTFDVPAGRSDVDVRLQDTAVRRLGNRISLVSWSALVLTVPVWLIAWRVRRRRRARH